MRPQILRPPMTMGKRGDVRARPVRVAQGISAGVYEAVLDVRPGVRPDVRPRVRPDVRPDVRRLPPCTAAGITGGAR